MQMLYNQEAAVWEEALPLGNGRIGAMVWSGVGTEKISLNDDTLWSGYPKTLNLPDKQHHFHAARALAMQGKYRQAQDYIEANMQGSYTQGYLPLCDMVLEMEDDTATEYNRVLDLNNAVVSLEYCQNKIRYKREYFVSAPDQVMVMRLSADVAGAISFAAQFTCQLNANATAEYNRLKLDGIAPSVARPLYHMGDEPIVYDSTPDKQGMRFAAIADFEVSGGETFAEGDVLFVKNADAVVIRFCCRTSFNGAFEFPGLNGAPYATNCEKDLAASLNLDYATLRDRHIADYQNLYNRVDINLGNSTLASLPLPERLANWQTPENDPELFALLFQYGRYLMISGSRPGTIPLNLQGIWNPHLHPPWSSNYTVNINTEMNYWPAESTNLSECHEPLIDFINTLHITGASIAKSQYGARGFTVNHNSDIWGAANSVGEDNKGACRWAFWPMAAGWFSAHVFNRYLYTQDMTFLRETAFPILRDASLFYLDVLTEDASGCLIFAPSTSPENDFIIDGKTCCVSKTTTMTTAIIKECLNNTIATCKLLEAETLDTEMSALREQAATAIKKLPPYQIGAKGQLLEWSEDLPEAEPEHRHTSHLYPLYPGYEIKPGTELADACARTLDLRGEEATGWALAWRISLWARLQKPERAFACLKKQLRPATGWLGGCYPNLFGAHPPFQIDSNFGATAGVTEMLLHSECNNGEYKIYLLPALPKAFADGHIKGLRAMGGVTVNIYFENGALKKAELTPDAQLSAREFTVVYEGRVQKVRLIPGKGFILSTS